MKTSNLLTLGILSILGFSVFYYFKNKKQIGYSNEKNIADTINKSVKQISETTKTLVENKIAELKKEEAVVSEVDKKESETFLKAIALSNQIKSLLLQNIRPKMSGESKGRYDLDVFLKDKKINQIKTEINNLGYQYLENGEITKK